MEKPESLLRHDDVFPLQNAATPLYPTLGIGKMLACGHRPHRAAPNIPRRVPWRLSSQDCCDEEEMGEARGFAELGGAISSRGKGSSKTLLRKCVAILLRPLAICRHCLH